MDFIKIQGKWQKKWEDAKLFESNEGSKKKKFYCLEMFPYPSASGLHMGHARNYIIGDIYSRFKRMNGFNVLYPMGYDALGLPAENAAIKAGTHPRKFTEDAINNFIKQQKEIGLSYDWSRMLKTCDPEYYRWNQYFFLKLYEKGLVYRKKAPVNWCPKCNTVLANEQVHNGKCWRHKDTSVEIKHLEQWFIKTTAYADELLEMTDALDWPERIKLMQKNWIGKSYGTDIDFEINGKKWSIFTTRPDTIYGVTFMVVSAQHPRLMELVTKEQKKGVEAFLKKIKSTSEKDIEELEKEGAFTGSYAVNPLTKDKIPVYAGNFVIAEYGSGMVMAVPAHDQRDFEFAKKYKIPIKQVIAPTFITNAGHDAVRKDKPTSARDSAIGIVKHWKEDKYFVLDWKEFSWKSFVIGGIEKGETPEEAVVREVKEETGYQDIKSVKPIGFEIHTKFFARHKDVNRHGKFKTFLVELGSDKYKKPEEEHTKNHIGKWLEKEKISGYINLEDNKFLWEAYTKGESAYTEEGTLVNSGEFNGINSREAIDEISKHLEKKKLGKRTLQYKLRDWLVSRQRYWGTPIPFVYCDKCGLVPVPEKELPIILPENVKFGEGNPLETNKEFVNAKCPKCGGKARRETDTMDTFFDSSWYFLRFCDNKNSKEPFAKEKVKFWMPVDLYVGGAEHACMHLIYARFFVKALRDLGLLKFNEPFTKLYNQGMLHGTDGFVMSKSRGNVVLPEEISKKYGIDTARVFLMFVASPDKDMLWDDKGISGCSKFMNKVISLFEKKITNEKDSLLESKTNRTIKEVTEKIESMQYNVALIDLMELVKFLSSRETVTMQSIESLLLILSPFCPHVCEELWEKLGNRGFIASEKWPSYDEKKINLESEYLEDIIANTKSDVITVLELAKIEKPKEIKLFVSDDWKYKLYKLVVDKLKETRDVGVIQKAVMATELKKFGKDIIRMIPRIIENPPKIVLNQEKELKKIKESKERIENEFKCKVEVVKEADSKEQKARQALPGKPAIIIS